LKKNVIVEISVIGQSEEFTESKIQQAQAMDMRFIVQQLFYVLTKIIRVKNILYQPIRCAC